MQQAPNRSQRDALRTVLDYSGPAVIVGVALLVNGQPLYTFTADMASAHFRGGEGSIVAHVRRNALRQLDRSLIDSCEKLELQCWLNRVRVARRAAKLHPGMSAAELVEYVEALVDWLGQWVLTGCRPIGTAPPLYRIEGRIVG